MTQAQTFDALAFVKAKRAERASGFNALEFVKRKRAEKLAAASTPPAPSPLGQEAQGPITGFISGAIRGAFPTSGFLADEAARALVRGGIGIPESAAGAVQGAGGTLETLGRMGQIAPAAGVVGARMLVQNPGAVARNMLLGPEVAPLPLDATAQDIMRAANQQADADPVPMVQAGRFLRNVTEPAMEFYGQRKADPAIAPSPLAQAQPFSPSGLTSSVTENLPQLAVQLAAAYMSGGAGASGRIAGFAGSAFPMELGAAQAAGREGFIQQGVSPEDAALKAAPGAALQAAVNTIIESVSGAGIFSPAEKAAAKAGLFRQAWEIMRRGARAGATGGVTEAAQEGVNIAGELASGSNPNAGQGAGMRMLQAGVVGGLLEGPAGAFEGGRESAVRPGAQPTAQTTQPPIGQAPDNPTAPPDNRGQAPDPSPLDEAAALAEQRLNQQFNTPAPVGSPLADQAASSQPEQGAVSDPTASVLPASQTGPVVGGATSPSPQSTREPWQMTRGEYRDWSYTKEYREARSAAEQADKDAENAVIKMEQEIGVDSRSAMQGLSSVDGVSPKAFGLVQAADAMRQQKEFNAALEAMPEQFRKKYADAVAKWERAHARARSFEDFNTAQEMAKEYGLSNPSESPKSSNSQAPVSSSNPPAKPDSSTQRAPSAATPSTPTSERPASGPQAGGRTATGTTLDAGTSPSPALPGVQPPASSGPTASQTGSAVGRGTSASPQSTREPWQMTRGEAEKAFEQADSNVFGSVRVEDWGRMPRGQGKRVGGMVMGGMASVPTGKKAYYSRLGTLDLSDEQRTELGAFDPNELRKYAKARAAGFGHDEAALYAYYDTTDPHRSVVEWAVRANKPVPPEVLAEYGLKPNPPAKPDSSTQPQGGSRLLGTRNRDTEEMRRARQRVENRKFRAFDRRRVKKENTARKNINHGFSGKAAPAPITRAEAEVATQEDMERLGQQVVESALGEPYGQIAHHPLVHKYVRVNVADYRPVDPTKDVYTEHETKVKQVEIWLAAEWRAREQRDALLRTLKSAGYKKVTVNANENGLVVQFVPTNDDVISQPQGQAAATTNKERTNGEEEAPQAQVLNTGTAAPAQGTGAVSAEPFTRTDGTAKEAGTKRVEELRATFKTKRAGWHFAETDEGATLIHPTEDRVVRFKANQSNQTSRARTYAQAFADDNPVKTEQTAPGQLKAQELKAPQPAPAKVEEKKGAASVAFRSPPPWKVRKELHDAGFKRDDTGAWVGPDTDEARAIAKRISDERDAYLAAKRAGKTPAESKPDAPKVETPAPAVPDKRAEQVKKLRAVAASKAEAAQAKMDQDRNTNTYRRSQMAASAIADARRELYKAEQLRKVADAIEAGSENLARIRTWSDLEELHSLIYEAKRKAFYAMPSEARDKMKGRSESDTDAIHRVDIADAIDHLHNALPMMQTEWIRDIRQKAESVRGLKKVAEQLPRFYDGEQMTPLSGRLVENLRIILAKVENRWMTDRLKGFGRLSAMSGSESDTQIDVPKLTALVREFGAATSNVKKAAEDPVKKAERELVGKVVGRDFFPTPTAVAADLVEKADIREGMKVLEPSAGNGRIADAIKNAGVQADVVELSPALRDILTLKGHNLVGQDFDEFNPGPVYDRIVMNPPFSDRSDVDHVRRAFDILKPGGRLVAIMSEGPFFGSDKKAAEFRDWVEEMGGASEKLPPNTFMQDKSGLPTTGVAARIVVLDKPMGVAKAATIAEYEKRIGITDTPEMFGGGTGGASPGIPFRTTPDINDRAAAKLLDWSSRARKRFDDYMGRQRRGEILGSGVDPTPYIDLAASVAFKALASGVTSKSGRKLTAFVEGRMADIRAKWPALNVTTATLRRQVRAMLAAANDDRDKIITAYAEARERAETARTKRAGKESGKPAEVREAVANATAERPDVAAKIIDAVKRGLRQGRAEGMRTASDALKPLIRQARDAAKRARQVAAIETRGAVDAAKAAAADRAATEKGIRDQAVRLVQETPIAGRRKYLKAVASAATMSDLARILHRLRGDLAKETGRHFALRAEKLEKNLRTLNADRRENARKLIDDVRKLYALLRDKDTGTARREEIAEQIRESFEALNTIFHEQKNQDKVSILGRAIQASDHREKMVESLEKRPEIPAPTNPNRKRDKGRIRVALDKFLTFQSLMQALDQEFYGNGMFARAGRAMAERRTAEFAKVQEFTDRADKIVRKYGYKGLGDFLAKSSGVLGEASQQWINVSLGEFKRITLGNALDIYARDAETREKMHKGQTFTFDAEGGTNSFTIDDNKLAEIENALTREQKQLAREVNRLRSDMQFDRMDEVYKLITGNYLVQVPEHYPIRRAMKLSESPDITKGLGEWTIRRMEEAGYLKQRVGGNAPIVIGDFGMTQLRQVQMAEAFIHRASIVKYLGATMLHPDVRKAVVRHHGTKIMDRIQQTISEFSGNESPQQDRLMRRLLSNIARAQTQVNIGTWARNLATAFNIPLAVVDGKLLGVRKTLRGIAGAISSPAKTMRILMKHSPDLRHRWSHAGASISLMHGNDVQASTDIADTAFGDASKATVRQILTALKAIKAGDFKNQTAEIARPWRQLLDAIKLGNVFDGFGAMVAYHAVRDDAPQSLSPNAADKWAARRAADIFSQTANTNDLLNSNEWQMDARRSTWMAGMLAFTSDIAKKQNLLYLATKRGKKATAYATAAVTLGALWSVAITAALSGALGDDEDKVTKRAAEGFAKELASLLPAGTVASGLVEAYFNPRGSSEILDTPVTAVIKNVRAAVTKFKDAAEDGDETDVMDGAYRVLRVLNDIIGAPFGPTAGMVKRAVVNYAE